MPHQVSAILLAAGLSKRMGKLKQLLPLGDRPVIVHCLENIRGAGVDDIVVVIDPEGDKIIEAIEAFPVTVVRNDSTDADMSQSVRAGFRRVNPDASGVFVCLSDQPLVKAQTLMRMRLCFAEKPGMIILPVYNGKKGHPPLLPRRFLSWIVTIPTLREVIKKHSGEVIRLEVNDEGVVLDMDTPEDYQRILKRFSSRTDPF